LSDDSAFLKHNDHLIENAENSSKSDMSDKDSDEVFRFFYSVLMVFQHKLSFSQNSSISTLSKVQRQENALNLLFVLLFIPKKNCLLPVSLLSHNFLVVNILDFSGFAQMK